MQIAPFSLCRTFFIQEAIRGSRVVGFAWVRRLMRIEEVVQALLCLQPLVTNDLSKRTLRPTSSLTIDNDLSHRVRSRFLTVSLAFVGTSLWSSPRDVLYLIQITSTTHSRRFRASEGTQSCFFLRGLTSPNFVLRESLEKANSISKMISIV